MLFKKNLKKHESDYKLRKLNMGAQTRACNVLFYTKTN